LRLKGKSTLDSNSEVKMRGKLKLLLLVGALLLLVGCAQSATAPPVDNTVVDGTPPMDRTWISPAKVQIGNFYPGARAEWNLTIHNGNDVTAEFAVMYREPDYTAGGYLMPPEETVKDWVIIADPAPLLLPYETRDILVSVALPPTATDSEIHFWYVTAGGLSHLDAIRNTIYEELLAECNGNGTAAQELLNSRLYADPEANLLMYLNNIGSVSFGRFRGERAGDMTLISEFQSKGYAAVGNLQTDNWEFWVSVRDMAQGGTVQTELCSRWLVQMQ